MGTIIWGEKLEEKIKHASRKEREKSNSERKRVKKLSLLIIRYFMSWESN